MRSSAQIPKNVWHPAWLKDVLSQIHPLDNEIRIKVQGRLDSLTKPAGSLGRLEEIACQYAVIRSTVRPKIQKKVVYTFAADHGVTEEKVSAYPKAVTAQMVLNFIRGGAALNVLARHVGAEVKVVDIGVDYDFHNMEGLIHRKVRRGTDNLARGPALSKPEALIALSEGVSLAQEAAGQGVDLLGTGDMGIGNTTPSSAVAAVLAGQPVEAVTGKGAGLDSKGVKHKMEVIGRALEVNQPDARDPVGVLAKVGGLEIAGIAGLLLGAASRRVPVVVDGFISSVGALIAVNLQRGVRDYIFLSHRSAEKGHRAVCTAMKLEPLLDLDLRLGEGTGACLGMSLVEAAVKLLNEMATFEEAKVSDKH